MNSNVKNNKENAAYDDEWRFFVYDIMISFILYIKYMTGETLTLEVVYDDKNHTGYTEVNINGEAVNIDTEVVK